MFSAGSAITYVTTTPVGNLSIINSSTVAWTAAGTFSTGGAIRTFDIGAGSRLNWNSQTVGTTAGTGFIKNGEGTWNIGTMGAGSAPGGFTLNAGRIITSGGNGVGNGPLVINGGTWEASGNASYNATSVTIGGNFAFEGSGNNAVAAASVGITLGNATRTITNNAGGYRQLTGVISGSSGAGLTFSGTGVSVVGNAANTFDGPFTVTGGDAFFNGNGALGSGTAIVLDGGRITSGSVATGASPGPSALTGAITLAGGLLDLASFAVGNAVTIGGGNLANAGSFTGPTTVTGTVSLASAPGSAVTVDAGGVLQGTPTVASLTGAGLVSPGNSPGIITAGSFDGPGGLGAA